MEVLQKGNPYAHFDARSGSKCAGRLHEGNPLLGGVAAEMFNGIRQPVVNAAAGAAGLVGGLFQPLHAAYRFLADAPFVHPNLVQIRMPPAMGKQTN